MILSAVFLSTQQQQQQQLKNERRRKKNERASSRGFALLTFQIKYINLSHSHLLNEKKSKS